MIITPTNFTPIRKNTPTQKSEFRKQSVSDTFTFTGNKVGILKHSTVDALQNIEYAYKDIMSHLLHKTDKGLENIEKEYENFSYKKGMVFHNCGEDKTSIAVRFPEGKDFKGLMRLMVRKGNTFFSERIVIDSYMIKDSDKLVSEFDKTHLNYFPKDYKLMSTEEIESTCADKKIQDIVGDLDYAMVQFRKYLNNNKDIDIKIPDFVIPYRASQKLDNLKTLNETITEKLKALPKKVALYAKNSFNDYELTTGQSTNMMRNIGSDNLKMSVSSINNPQHGALTRLMVYDKTDSPVSGYLINSEGKIISNFNPEYLAIIPPKLILLDENEAKTVLPKFEEHMSLFEEKLKSFIKHIDGIYKKRTQRLKDIEARKAAAALKKEAKAAKPEKVKEPKPKKEPKLKQESISQKTIKEPKPVKIPKKIPVSRQKEYKELMKESLVRLKNSMSEVNENLDDFKKTMAQIQKDFEDYFESHK